MNQKACLLKVSSFFFFFHVCEGKKHLKKLNEQKSELKFMVHWQFAVKNCMASLARDPSQLV